MVSITHMVQKLLIGSKLSFEWFPYTRLESTSYNLQETYRLHIQEESRTGRLERMPKLTLIGK